MGDTPSSNNNETNNLNNNGGSSWAMYQRLVLSEIARLDKVLQTVEDKGQQLATDLRKDLSDAVSVLKKQLADLDKAIAVMQAKAAIYGTLAGAVITALIEYVLHKLK